MKIKTGRVRRLFDEALSNRKICNNMLIMAISAVCNEIDYNKNIGSTTVERYIEYRKIFAETAVTNGVQKATISHYIKELSPDRYPSDKQITILAEIISSGEYSIEKIICDTDLILLSDDEIEERAKKTRIKRNQLDINEQKLFREVCDYISEQFIHKELSTDIQAKLKTVKTSYDIVLQTLKWYKEDIYKSMNNKHFKNDYEKFCYIYGVLNKKIPESINRIERKKQEDMKFWEEMANNILSEEISFEEMMYLQCDKYSDTLYYGKHDYVKEQLSNAIDRLKNIKAVKKAE